MDDVFVAKMLSRRRLLGYGLGALGASALTACGSSSKQATAPTSTTTPGPTTTGSVGGADLLAKARTEGHLTTAAVGAEHSYYEPVIAAFEKFAGFEVTTKNPTYPASFQVKDLAEAAKANKKPPYDVIEVTPATADQAVSQKLLEHYVSSLWTDIPSVFKSGDGEWSAAYFGVISFITNTKATGGFLPGSWDELATSSKTPKGSFAMLGDPRSGKPLEGGLGLLTVMSAAIANGGSPDDVEPGLKLLGELSDKGIFDLKGPSSLVALPDDAGTAPTPINALYSFDLPLAKWSARQNFTRVESAAPSDGLVAGYYPQAIAAGAVNPSAARLWIEFLQSDQGAAVFLANGAIPTRAAAIRESGSDELRKALPPSKETEAPVPSAVQITAAQKVIDEKWTTYIPVTD